MRGFVTSNRNELKKSSDSQFISTNFCFLFLHNVSTIDQAANDTETVKSTPHTYLYGEKWLTFV